MSLFFRISKLPFFKHIYLNEEKFYLNQVFKHE